jgi:hypothetical protein
MSDQATGRQPDGTYVPCPECRWEPPIERNPPPGRPVHFAGTRHYGDCPTVAMLSPAEERELQAKLDEMDRVRRRGAAEAANFVVG